ncbi:Molybdopterin synthase catalytic subunit [Clonorchis sinensis]|uniref:Molybdopterin synthase catalytic subunit n=1 Tax=Clonorchis sinensis TaxID=79923 RepID=A0A8T1M527_CLOSI|nr:Molybdopterin synthase catalytic subunit [Clonorchis sinensis]
MSILCENMRIIFISAIRFFKHPCGHCMKQAVRARILLFGQAQDLTGVQSTFILVPVTCTAKELYSRILGYFPQNLNLKGTTRSTNVDNPVTYLNYEAYNSMALTVMKTIAKECRIQWPKVEYFAIIHRLGKVPVGEVSIGIAVSSPHRADALQAVQFIIEATKSRVPIWKKLLKFAIGAQKLTLLINVSEGVNQKGDRLVPMMLRRIPTVSYLGFTAYKASFCRSIVCLVLLVILTFGYVTENITSSMSKSLLTYDNESSDSFSLQMALQTTHTVGRWLSTHGKRPVNAVLERHSICSYHPFETFCPWYIDENCVKSKNNLQAECVFCLGVTHETEESDWFDQNKAQPN